MSRDAISRDLVRLYSARLLALAADIPHLGRLEAPTGSAMARAPLCGSQVTVDIVLKDGRIVAFAQDVKACALGQASASVLGSKILGCRVAEVAAAREALHAMLAGNAPPPPPPFEGLAALLPAREHPHRHASVLLAFDALLAAAQKSAADT